MNSHSAGSTRAALAQAALQYAATHPWREVSLLRLAALANLSPAALHPATPMDAVEAIEALFDQAVAEPAIGEQEEPRERLFDLCMRRFEAMEPHRAALASIEGRDPLVQTAFTVLALRSALWILGLAGLASAPADLLRVGPLALILLRARAAWRKDTAGDFARTMVSLDRDLRQAETAEMRLAPLRQGLGFSSQRREGRKNQAGAQAA